MSETTKSVFKKSEVIFPIIHFKGVIFINSVIIYYYLVRILNYKFVEFGIVRKKI